MVLYRLSKCKYSTDLSGEGARRYGGRWHSKGVSVVYMASSKSLALLEVLVHLPVALFPDDFCMATFELPENSIHELKPEVLPDNWKQIQHQENIQQIGNAFVKEKDKFLLKVPSVIVKDEYNYLLNPTHRDMKKVKLLHTEIFTFDSRLI